MRSTVPDVHALKKGRRPRPAPGTKIVWLRWENGNPVNPSTRRRPWITAMFDAMMTSATVAEFGAKINRLDTMYDAHAKAKKNPGSCCIWAEEQGHCKLVPP